jgi:signal transduction histidine kinase
MAIFSHALATAQDVTGLIRNAIQGAKRGASLTQRRLAFSRKQELELQPVDIPDLVRSMTDMLRRSLGPIEINTNFPLGLPKVQCDPNQLENARSQRVETRRLYLSFGDG